MARDAAKEEAMLKDQTNLLPKRQLIVVVCAMACSLFICVIDQNAISVMLPTIGRDLNALDTISWAGTASFISSTIFQALYGRLSDIFGRKSVFLSAMAVLAVANIMCGFARTGTQLYVFRGIAGVANGGIAGLTAMIVSDVVTLENRGYQGILGAVVGLGGAIGPFLAAALLEKATWRAIFWLLSPMTVLTALITWWHLPPCPITGGSLRGKVRKIDFAGVTCLTAAIMLLLIPISGGGTYFAWKSPMVISMMALGGVFTVLFVLAEWKVAKLPMMPLRLFCNPAVAAILVQNVLMGITYFSNGYYLPIYAQVVRGYSAMTSAGITLPVVLGQSVFSVLSGQYISRRKRYGEIIWIGYVMWTTAIALKAGLFTRTGPPPAAMAFILLLEGAGVGSVFQPTLIAAQAHSIKADRAVVISARNFLRSMGGAIGLAISASVFSNTLNDHIPDSIPAALAAKISSSIYNVPDLSSLPKAQHIAVLEAYLQGARAVFIMFVPVMVTCLLLTSLIKDRGLQRPDEVNEPQKEKEAVDSASESSGSSRSPSPAISADVERGCATAPVELMRPKDNNAAPC